MKQLISPASVFIISLSLVVFLWPSESRKINVYAQLPTCQSLVYPCQEGLIFFPSDEGKHPDKQVEWWYANFNVETYPGWLPLAGAISLVRVNPGIGDQGYALLEISNEATSPPKFFSQVLAGTITSTTDKQDVSFIANPGSEVSSIRFYQTGKAFQYKLEVVGQGIDIDGILVSQKKPLVEGGDGYVPIFPDYPDEESGYYSLTHLSLTDGLLNLPDTPPLTINGIAWIDHQWFDVPSGIISFYSPQFLSPHHEWFSLQLDNNVQIVAWEIFRETEGVLAIGLKNLDIIDSFGKQITYEDFLLDPSSSWTAPDGKLFANAWRLKVGEQIDLSFETSIPNQYVGDWKTYEGSINITGFYYGSRVQGQGFAEMTLGYDSSCLPLPEKFDGLDNDCDFRIDEVCSFFPGWNEIVWPNIAGKKASDVPSECPMAVTQENFWLKPHVKNYGGGDFGFDNDRIYYLKCNQEVTWSF
jgi:predicted secreted hydrolase